ncbi:hypothetical protein ACOSP7_026311 [Xanthoceras sorbifolium]
MGHLVRDCRDYNKGLIDEGDFRFEAWLRAPSVGRVRGFGDRRSGTEDSKQEAEIAKEEVKTNEAPRSKVAQGEVHNIPNDAPISVAPSVSVSVEGLGVVGSEGIDGSGSTVFGDGFDLVDSFERSKVYIVDEKADDRLVEEFPHSSVCGRGQDVWVENANSLICSKSDEFSSIQSNRGGGAGSLLEEFSAAGGQNSVNQTSAVFDAVSASPAVFSGVGSSGTSLANVQVVGVEVSGDLCAGTGVAGLQFSGAGSGGGVISGAEFVGVFCSRAVPSVGVVSDARFAGGLVSGSAPSVGEVSGVVSSSGEVAGAVGLFFGADSVRAVCSGAGSSGRVDGYGVCSV